jgi:hypothetical protein
MFRQFGSRVIAGGRRVRDDYWESKAREQGFTEGDSAGEKRPGAGRASEAAVVETQVGMHHIFSHGLGFEGMQAPGLHLASGYYGGDDLATWSRNDSSTESAIMNQVAYTADFSWMLMDYSNRPLHESTKWLYQNDSILP